MVTGTTAHSEPGKTVAELAASTATPQVRVSSVERIRAAGGDVIPTRRGPMQPFHATVIGLTLDQLDAVFDPPIPIPTEPAAAPDWRDDWLYALVLRQAEQNWEWCRRARDRDVWQYVLVGEWSSADGAMCHGEVVRAWVRDAEGLREITPGEYGRHLQRVRGRTYPFVLVSFHIHSDRQRVALGMHAATTAGGGCRYLVHGKVAAATLEPDPQGGAWRS